MPGLATRKRVDVLMDDKGVPRDTVRMLVEVGSTVHGIATGSDDLDLTAIRVELWPEFAWSELENRRQSMMIRTQPDGVKSGPGDIDINLYTWRKFVKLALKGNPSILVAMWSPKHLRPSDLPIAELNELIASRKVGAAFKGYIRAQLERWQGQRGQKNVRRPELVDAHGYDTKYAAHAIRLGLQGIEYMNTARLTLPMAPEEAGWLRSLREGIIPEKMALARAADVEVGLLEACDASDLPPWPDTLGAQRLVAEVYGDAYGLL